MEENFKYIEDRLNEQKKWHSEKAGMNKKKYYIFEIIMLTAGSAIPVINVIDDISGFIIRILSAGLAAISVVSAGIAKLYQFQENWLNFRAVSEALGREKEYYLYRVGEYDQKDESERQKLLIERVENIIATSTDQFLYIHKSKKENL